MSAAADSIHVDCILPDLRAANARDALRAFADHAAKITGVEAAGIFGRMLAQEEKGTSGIGGGVAIVQMKSANLKAPLTLFARLVQPIDFDALDGRPVDIVLCLMSPEKDGPFHLQRLYRLTRMMRREKLLLSLRSCAAGDALHAVLTGEDMLRLAA